MKEIDNLIELIKQFLKDNDDNKLIKAYELFYSIDVKEFSESNINTIYKLLKPFDNDDILYYSPLNIIYSFVCSKLNYDIELSILFNVISNVTTNNIYYKQLFYYEILMTYFDDEITKIAMKEYYKLDEFSTPSLNLSAKGLIEKDNDLSIKHFTKALLEDKNNWVASLNIGSYYFKNNNYENAVRHYLQVFRQKELIDDFNITSYLLFDIGSIYLGELKEYSKAERYYKILITEYSYTEGLYNNYGYNLYCLGKYKSAEKYLKLAVKNEKNKEMPLWNLLRIYKKNKDYSNALKILNKLKTVSRKKKTIIDEIDKIEKNNFNTDFNIKLQDTLIEKSSKHISKFNKTKSISQESVLEELIHNRIKRGQEVFQRRLKIYQDDIYYGQQINMPDVGRLDLLVVDVDTNELIVVELKRDESYNDVISQTLGYIKWIKKHIGKNKYKVKGIICLHTANKELIVNAKKEGLEIQEYSFEFSKIV